MICKKCNKIFPVRYNIGTKIVNLKSRKYCLECSPYGSHNTIQLERGRLTDQTGQRLVPVPKKCKLCGQIFCIRRKGRCCSSCTVKKARRKAKLFAVEYKGGKCIACGYNKCLKSLCFHHLDPNVKSFSIGGYYYFHLDILKKELDKCVLLCHNCHNELHEGLINL